MSSVKILCLLLIACAIAINGQATNNSNPLRAFAGYRWFGRYWGLQSNANYSAADANNVLFRALAPGFMSASGFEEYLGSLPTNTSTLFGYNVFSEPVSADTVQSQAQNLVASSPLASQISPILLLSGNFSFFIASDSVNGTNPIETGYFLTTRYYQVLQSANMSNDQIMSTVLNQFAPQIAALPGFREYAGILLDDPTHMVFYNIFETRQQSDQALTMAADFVNAVLVNDIQRMVLIESAVMFDVIPGMDCTPPLNPPISGF